MVKIAEIISLIENFAPLSLQADFDNCGLKLGNLSNTVDGIMVTLDTNYEVIEEALDNHCNLIIEHHPLIFTPIKKLDFNLPSTKALHLAIKNDIALYSAHTNIDFCKNGLNDYVAKQMGLSNIYNISADSPRIGYLSECTTLKEYTEYLKTLFKDNNITTIGNLNKPIKKVAVINGGGGSDINDVIIAMNCGADVFITGDIKYHVARFAKDSNYAIINIGHYNSEQGFSKLISKLIQNKYSSIPIYETTKLTNPYN